MWRLRKKQVTDTDKAAATKPAKTRKRLSRKWIILIVILVILVVLGLAGYVVARRLTGPAVGTIVTNMPPEAHQNPPDLEQFDGTTFSFVHPVTYIEQTQKPKAGNTDLEDRTFISTGMTSQLLTAVVTKFPSGNLNDESSYIIRNQDPKKYQRKVVVVQNEQVVIFTHDDGGQLQQTAFWPHAGKLLTFSLTGVAQDTQASSSEFLSMVESITWR